MKENLVHIIAAILLGLVLPGAVVKYSKPPQLQTTTPETVQTIETTEQVTKQGIWVLNSDNALQWLDLDTYLTGVILAEMPTSFDHQALCAQAIVARTYALRRQMEARHEHGAICTDPGCCQAYVEETKYLSGLGYKEDIEIARAAVNDTSGLVLTYEGELIEATYFHCAGGRTEEAVAVWGVDYPYLQSVESPGEEEFDEFVEEVYYSREELEIIFGRALSGKPSSWVGLTTYTVGGGVENMVFAGIQYSGVRLRSLLKLNSTAFTIVAENDGIWITTRGKGHRVGMSQNGAQVMAQQGSTYQQILAHYYKGTRIDKLTDLGYNTSKISKE